MTVAPYDALRQTLEAHGEPPAPELWVTLAEVLGNGAASGRPMSLERVKRKVYRIRDGADDARSLVLKRHKDAGDARRARLVCERWLPALGFEGCCPRVLGTAADRHGRWVWQLYEDFGIDTLLTRPDRPRLGAAVDLIADLHTRATGHPLLCQVRADGADYGVHHFWSALRDADRALEALPASRLPGDSGRARDRLRRHLDRLRRDTRRIRVLAEASEPETMLHGDLLAKNVIVAQGPQGSSVRLLDWDHVGVGPVSYDLSTFLTRFPASEREWIVSRYRDAVRRLGGDLPGVAELNLLLDTAEQARCAEYVAAFASKLLLDGERVAPTGLLEIEGWIQALRPLLPATTRRPARRAS
ncbi:MAG TPA: phosphotransferase [Gemmatimonadales bacterium]|jgi:aminoglycoside/choline kinase family phosphotransferase|nr:phosphotransferase [Gemmatimonadales bacterium]